MDNLQGKNLDRLFRQKLEHLEQRPDPQAWESLAQKLKNKRVPLWWLPARYAAGLLAVIGLGLFMYLKVGKQDLERYTADNIEIEKHTELFPNEPSGSEAPVSPEKEEVIQDSPSSSEKEGTIDSPSSHQAAPKIPPQNPKTQAADHENPKQEEAPSIREELPVLEIPKMELLEIDLSSSLADGLPPVEDLPVKEVEYRVRIISRGYAIAPGKGDIVEEIEQQVGKIGNFLTKVDQGFADLQDAKNDFFALMVTKKEKQ
jgi:hypothetical protein